MKPILLILIAGLMFSNVRCKDDLVAPSISPAVGLNPAEMTLAPGREEVITMDGNNRGNSSPFLSTSYSTHKHSKLQTPPFQQTVPPGNTARLASSRRRPAG